MSDVAALLAQLTGRSEPAADPALAAVKLARATIDALVLRMGQSIDARVTAQLAGGLTQLTAGSDSFVLKLETPLPINTAVTVKSPPPRAANPPSPSRCSRRRSPPSPPYPRRCRPRRCRNRPQPRHHPWPPLRSPPLCQCRPSCPAPRQPRHFHQRATSRRQHRHRCRPRRSSLRQRPRFRSASRRPRRPRLFSLSRSRCRQHRPQSPHPQLRPRCHRQHSPPRRTSPHLRSPPR